ncbi:hypothetical protein AURDEDRAFT_30267, partial [Auricularia subglabra TFB-10046 SS5]
KHTVYEAELVGILLALRIIANCPDVLNATVCLDNQSAVTCTYNPCPKPGQLITIAIYNAYKSICATWPGFHLSIIWVPGHEGIDGNKWAD